MENYKNEIEKNYFKTSTKALARFAGAEEEATFITGNFSSAFQNFLIHLPKGFRFLVLEDEYPSLTGIVEDLGFDLNADIAVLGIIDSIDLKPFKIRKNIDQVKVGESVIAIGNPQGLGQSFSKGIVSAINRSFQDKKGNFIQTDASINPGNSGGALIDDKGRLLGIVNVIRSTSGGNQGLNFAIPVDTVIEVFNSIVDK